jgi:hypothetical protein
MLKGFLLKQKKREHIKLAFQNLHASRFIIQAIVESGCYTPTWDMNLGDCYDRATQATTELAENDNQLTSDLVSKLLDDNLFLRDSYNWCKKHIWPRGAAAPSFDKCFNSGLQDVYKSNGL